MNTEEKSSVTLDPDYRLSIGIVILSLPLLVVSPWATAIVGLFGIFLIIQTATLRLVFSDSALDIYRGSELIRQFPYAEWLNWEIFISPVPILFYFREVNSIHFLPILFSPAQLRMALETRIGSGSVQITVEDSAETISPSPENESAEHG